MSEFPKTLDLVRLAQSGEREALDALFERYLPRAMKIIRMRMGTRLRWRQESADLLQDTFAEAIRAFDRFEMRDESSFLNWLARIAEHSVTRAAAHDRAQKRDVGREIAMDAQPLGGGSADDLPAAWMVPLDRMIREEEERLLESCIAALPEHYREVIILRNALGLSFAEIAQETERPSEGAARMMHAKSMAELVRLVDARQGRSRHLGSP
ncbi:MAG: sigma-70 family RNA polymerase sigma factor [Planctomycetes bacterium]|nr:sigma-70 family RNA polymerase sigma factor [Planctomycetota bacterium]